MDTKVTINFGKNQSKVAGEKLATLFVIAFAAGSAHANISGENRDMACNSLKGIIPAMGKFESVTIDSDEETITVKADGIVNLLSEVEKAVKLNDAFRAAVENSNTLYKASRDVVSKVEKETGKRGRKASDPAVKYAVAADNLFA